MGHYPCRDESIESATLSAALNRGETHSFGAEWWNAHRTRNVRVNPHRERASSMHEEATCGQPTTPTTSNDSASGASLTVAN